MKTKKSRATNRLMLPLSIVAALIVTLLITPASLAELLPELPLFSQWSMGIMVGGLEPQVPTLADLPPRPGGAAAAVAHGAAFGGHYEENPRGGWIEIQVLNVTDPTLWSIVQWQDSAGNWLDIDSWLGTFDRVEGSIGVKKWWVDAKDFNTKFRWIVFKGNRNNVLFTSQPVSVKEYKQEVILPALIQTPN